MNSIQSYLMIKNLSYDLPTGETLFKNINFTLNNFRYGLVGDNGVGKTTIAKILAGQLFPTEGEILCEGQVVLLQQNEDRVNLSMTVVEYLNELWESLFADPKVWGPLLADINMETEVAQLSGGEWTRVRIAKQLSKPSQLLILDEPTNNLDAEAKNKIEDFIKYYSQSSLLIISHDRQILNAMDTILELTNQGISMYGGNFDFYYKEKQNERKRQLLQLESLKKQKKKVEKEWAQKVSSQEKRMRTGAKNKDSMPKIIAGLKKKQAENTKNKIQKNERQKFEQSTKKIDQAYSQLKVDRAMSLEIPLIKIPNGKKIFELKDANLSFADFKKIWSEDLNITVQGSKRIALLGANGVGKSSLIKGLLNLYSVKDRVTLYGQWQLGKVHTYLLDQNYSLLDTKKNVLENIMIGSSLDGDEVRNRLALMQFEKDKVFQNIETLSGGEKLKVSLAKIFMSDPAPEFLILDEPTNHLDLGSLETLEQSLLAFCGALLVISHDEVFLNRIDIDDRLILLPNKNY